MTVLRRVLASTFLLLFTSSGQTANVWLSNTQVSGIYPKPDGKVILTFVNDSPSCTNTSVPKQYTVAVNGNGVTSAGQKYIVSTAMLALSANLTVDVFFNDASSYCGVNAINVRK